MALDLGLFLVEGFELYHVCPKNVLLKNEAAYMEKNEVFIQGRK